MTEDSRQELIRTLQCMVAELWEALAREDISTRGARTLRDIEIVRRFLDEALAPEELARQYDLSPGQVVRILRRFHVSPEVRQAGRARRDERLAHAFTAGGTLRQLAERHGLSPVAVARSLRRRGLLPAAEPPANAKAERNRTIVRLVTEKGWTYQRAADAFGISRQRVGQIVCRAGAAPPPDAFDLQALREDRLVNQGNLLTREPRLASRTGTPAREAAPA